MVRCHMLTPHVCHILSTICVGAAQVKKKMSKEAFLKNNRGINDGQDLPESFMSALYDRIVNNEIKMKDDTAIMSEWQA